MTTTYSRSSRTNRSWLRVVLWLLLVAAAVFRPGIDRIDRRLAHRFWNVPSQWNAVADAAIRTGVVDSTIGGAPAPWRQASVVPVATSRAAIVVVSDMQHSIVTVVDEQYRVLGRFERTTSDPAVVTDEARGYKPLSNVWPFAVHDGRLETLLAFAPLVSEAPNRGLFAYVSIGREENELLFAIQLRWGPGPTWGVLERTDVNNDGFEDFVVHPQGRQDLPLLATFTWNPARRSYDARTSPEARPLMTWWSTAVDRRITIPQYRPIDDVVPALMKMVGG
jgi:hypothetical protein